MAVVNLPFYHPGYTPEPGSAPRVVLGAGITPATGFRVGTSFTRGPYLSSSTAPALLLGRDWKAYKQLILAGDVRFSRGYFEFQGEFGYSRHEAPGFAPVDGYAYYGELKYTFSPRAFAAVRLEQNNYPFIRAFGPVWVAQATNMYNGEAGIGYRLTAGTLVKVSFRADHWAVDPSLRPTLPDGHSIAFQVSNRFDVLSWFDRKQ